MAIAVRDTDDDDTRRACHVGVRPTKEELARLVARVRTFALESVGSCAWREQRADIARLRALAYDDAVNTGAADDDSDGAGVRDAVAHVLMRTQKFETLVRELLCAETWRVEALPRALELEPALTQDVVMNFAIYLTIYHESVLCNLLELTLFEQGAYEDVSDDAVAELADYCHRALVRLNASAKATALDDDSQSLASKITDVEFATSLSALGILRSITDTLSERTLGVQARLLDSYDALGVLTPLLDSKPWLRRSPDGNHMQQYDNGVWYDVNKADEWDKTVRIGKYEAQVWLAAHALLCEPSCRRKYQWDETRKATVLRLKKHLNESKVDQLPVLRDIARVLDELSINAPQLPQDVSQGRFILEVIPTIRTELTHGVDYHDLAQQMIRTHFNVNSSELKRDLAADLISACEILTPPERKAQTSIESAPNTKSSSVVKIDILRERRSLSSSEISYDAVCALEYDIDGDPTEVYTKTSNARGLRRKLKRREVDDAHQQSTANFRPFDGKIRITYESRMISSILRLRPTIDHDKPNMWITVGALKTDGFAAQLKLVASTSDVTYRLTDAYITIRAHE